MKVIGSVKEDLAVEKRISISLETAKKFINLNFSVMLEKNYGKHLGITDEEYKSNGVILQNSAEQVLEKTDILLRVNCLSNNEIKIIKDKSIVIGQIDPFVDKEKINKLIEKKNKYFFSKLTTKNNKSTNNGRFIFPSKFSRL